MAAVAAGSVTVALLASTGAAGTRVRVISPPVTAPSSGAASVVPVRPEAMAVGPNGNLYVADDGRDQILERLPDGRFVVVAGNGRPGFSGDGGPAVAAELDDPTGMAFAADGTLYFADQANYRVRALLPDGTIETVAGGGSSGTSGFVTTGTAARRALFNPYDVTVGPHGRLYIATGEQVLRLDTDARLTVVVGSPSAPAGLYGIGGSATAGSADGADGIAFDSAGNLYLAGFNTKSLLMVTPGGTLTEPPDVGALYPRGNGGLVATPAGAVLAMDTERVLTISPSGTQTYISFQDGTFDGITGFSPNGIAVGPDGTVYMDTYIGNGYADRSAIAAISPQYAVRLLWEGTTSPSTPTTQAPPTAAPTTQAPAPTAPAATTVPPATTTPTTGAGPSGTAIVLGGGGVGDVDFGTAEAPAVARLDRLLGRPTTASPQSQTGGCDIDATMQWPTLIVYFDRGSFVGYSTLDPNGQNLSDSHEGTAAGLEVGDSLARAEQIYGAAFTTSFAQGGSWSATTPDGNVDGYLTSEPNQTPAARIASIEAGDVGCPAASP